MQVTRRNRCQTRTRPRKKACVYGVRVSRATIYSYVGGNPMTRTDPSGLDWIYVQSTGQLMYQPPAAQGGGPPQSIGSGYSGIPLASNNGALESLPGIGPIPVGNYTIGAQQTIVTNAGHQLPGAMRLTPEPGQFIWGRDGFIIHGSNDYQNRTGSNGCPIFTPNIRNQIGNSPDKRFVVIP